MIGIIAILAGLLLPALGRAKGKAQITKCITNLRQIGVGVKLYASDNSDTMPPMDTDQQAGNPATPGPIYFAVCMGGKDPVPALAGHFAMATNRPLQRYVPAAEAFHCPADKGQVLPPGWPDPEFKPNDWDSVGCSYRFNGVIHPAPSQLRQVADDYDHNLCGKKESWVPDPARFIMMHEPPAYAWATMFYHWHYASGKTDINISQLPQDGQKFIAPIVFVDGHAKTYDFTKALKQPYPIEPTADWIWYKPKPQ